MGENKKLTDYEISAKYPLTEEEAELEAKGYEEWLKTQPKEVRREHEKRLKKFMESQTKLVNFRLAPEEAEGLKILAELTGVTQTDIIRDLIRAEIRNQSEAIKAYKDSIDQIKRKLK